MSDSPSTPDLVVVAHHEAAHAVISYRTKGHAGEDVSIVPNADQQSLGLHLDAIDDSLDQDAMRGRVLCLYAAGHAQRKVDRELGDYGCGSDEESAADLLEEYGWQAQEAALREESRRLVDQHWEEIARVARELLEYRVLVEIEIELLADIAAGSPDVTEADLAWYRQRHQERLDALRRAAMSR